MKEGEEPSRQSPISRADNYRMPHCLKSGKLGHKGVRTYTLDPQQCEGLGSPRRHSGDYSLHPNLTCVFLQLYLPTQLHSPGTLGHRTRDLRRQYPADHPSEQIPVQGTPGRTKGRLVSPHPGRVRVSAGCTSRSGHRKLAILQCSSRWQMRVLRKEHLF